MTDTLVTTLIRELQSKVPSRLNEAELVVRYEFIRLIATKHFLIHTSVTECHLIQVSSLYRRFIRSVARVFVIISVEAAPSFKKG